MRIICRSSVQAVESSLHARDTEIVRLTRRLDASRETEITMEAKSSTTQVDHGYFFC